MALIPYSFIPIFCCASSSSFPPSRTSSALADYRFWCLCLNGLDSGHGGCCGRTDRCLIYRLALSRRMLARSIFLASAWRDLHLTSSRRCLHGPCFVGLCCRRNHCLSSPFPQPCRILCVMVLRIHNLTSLTHLARGIRLLTNPPLALPPTHHLRTPLRI
jgi:hypothetical protein